MNMKKGLLAALCVAIVVASTVYATLAYFTDSEAVTNTFSVGQVHIDLDEEDVDNSSPLLDRDKANEYHLVPGSTYVKDPTVHVQADSNDAWLFVKVVNGIKDIEAASVTGGYQTIETQIIANGWKPLPNVENVYYCEYDAEADPSKTDFVVFETFKIDGDKTMNVTPNQPLIPGKYNIADYENATITVTAYAIQMAGFEEAEAAWTAGNWS